MLVSPAALVFSRAALYLVSRSLITASRSPPVNTKIEKASPHLVPSSELSVTTLGFAGKMASYRLGRKPSMPGMLGFLSELSTAGISEIPYPFRNTHSEDLCCTHTP